MDLLAIYYNRECDGKNESSYCASDNEIILRCFHEMGGWSHCETASRGSVRDSNSYVYYGRVQCLLKLFTKFIDNSKQYALGQGGTGVVSHTWRELDINREVHSQGINISFWKSWKKVDLIRRKHDVVQCSPENQMKWFLARFKIVSR